MYTEVVVEEAALELTNLAYASVLDTLEDRLEAETNAREDRPISAEKLESWRETLISLNMAYADLEFPPEYSDRTLALNTNSGVRKKAHDKMKKKERQLLGIPPSTKSEDAAAKERRIERNFESWTEYSTGLSAILEHSQASQDTQEETPLTRRMKVQEIETLQGEDDRPLYTTSALRRMMTLQENKRHLLNPFFTDTTTFSWSELLSYFMDVSRGQLYEKHPQFVLALALSLGNCAVDYVTENAPDDKVRTHMLKLIPDDLDTAGNDNSSHHVYLSEEELRTAGLHPDTDFLSRVLDRKTRFFDGGFYVQGPALVDYLTSLKLSKPAAKVQALLEEKLK